jgi:hypothetical protein
VEGVKSLIASLFLASCSLLLNAQEWHPMASSFCSEIKAKGAKVSARPFRILEAQSANTACCEGLSVKANAKTEEFGHFRVVDLDRGRYFLSFDLKTKQVNVPISVERLVDKRYVGRECEPTSRITVDRKTNQVTWEEWVIVD